MEFSPYRLYDSVTCLYWLYTEWMLGEDAWSMQVSFLCFDVLCHINMPKSQLPAGATLLGTVLSLDKTNILVLTGDRVAHPLLISLANIKMDTQLKLSSQAFLLAALLPVPKFVHNNKQMKGVLEACLIH